MTISKETLEKGLFHLIKEADAKKTESSEIAVAIKKKYQLENFKVVDISREWSWSLPGDDTAYYQVALRHADQNDVWFEYRQLKGIDRISWSSWSYHNMNDKKEQVETIEKSLSYIEAVKEMLYIMKDEEALNAFCNTVITEWVTEYIPVKNELSKIASQIREIKDSIANIDAKNELESAREYLIGKTRYTSDWFEFNSRNRIKEIVIEQDAKGKITVIDDNLRKKKVDDSLLVDIYRHLTRWNVRAETNWDVDYNDPNRKTYYKYQNEVDSSDKMYVRLDVKDMIQITEEESKQIKGY